MTKQRIPDRTRAKQQEWFKDANWPKGETRRFLYVAVAASDCCVRPRGHRSEEYIGGVLVVELATR